MITLYKTLYRDWVDPSLKPSLDFPFTVKLSLLGPTVELNLNSIKKDLQWLWSKLGGEQPDPEKILTVEQCIKGIQAEKLKTDDAVCVGALCEKIVPRKIILKPKFSAGERNIAVMVGEGASAFCPSVGAEFFSGIPCNYIYLAQVNWKTAFYLRAYFPAIEVGKEFLTRLNNMGVAVMGKLDKTASPYSCTRKETETERISVDEFINTIDLAVRVKALFSIKQWDPIESIKTYKEVEGLKLIEITDRDLDFYF